MTKIQKWALQAAVTVLALAVASLAVPSARAQDAEKNYKAKCVSCHGPDGSGTPVGKKLGARDLASADVQKQTDAQLAEIITKGKNKMPAYSGKLSKDETDKLVAYIRELGKKKH